MSQSSLPEILKTAASMSEKNFESPTSKTSYKNCFLACFASMMFIFTMGMTISYPAPATMDMKRSGSRLHDITANDITWIGSLTLLGGVPANILGGYLSHKFGRKAVLMFSPLYLSAWLMITYAPTVEWLCAGRIVSGFCTGLFCVVGPAYLTEISPNEIRGLVTSAFVFSMNLGILTVMGLGIVLRWSWLALTIAILVTFSACLMIFMPESPVWLVKESRIGEAANALKFLRGRHCNITKEIQEIIGSLSRQEHHAIGLRDLKNPIFYKPIAISICLLLFHQTAGSGCILTYTVEIFHDAGRAVDPNVAATVLAAIQVIAGVVCGSMIDKYGRRKLYISSGIGTSLTLSVLGAYSLAIKRYDVDMQVLGYIPLLCFSIFAFVFTLGIGSLPFVVIPEIVTIRYRSAVLSLTFLFASVSGFVVVKSFNNVRDSFGYYGMYWTYAFLTAVSVAFGFFVLPETKNLSIDEISKSFVKSKN